MATKSEQIMTAVAALVADTAGVQGRVYRSRTEAFSRNESPSLVIEPGIDNADTQPVSSCGIDWTFQLLVAIYTRGMHGINGPSPDQVADPVVQSVHSKLMADRTIGGLAFDIWPISRDPQIASGEDPVMWTLLTYRVRYRTNETDLSL